MTEPKSFFVECQHQVKNFLLVFSLKIVYYFSIQRMSIKGSSFNSKVVSSRFTPPALLATVMLLARPLPVQKVRVFFVQKRTSSHGRGPFIFGKTCTVFSEWLTGNITDMSHSDEPVHRHNRSFYLLKGNKGGA